MTFFPGAKKEELDALEVRVDELEANGAGTTTDQTITGDWDFTGELTSDGLPVIVEGDVRLSNTRTPTDSSVTYERLDGSIASAVDKANTAVQLDEETGLLDPAILPALPGRNTFIVADEEAMLALDADTGDFAIREDTSETWVLQGDDPTDIDDWVELPTSASVSSVNGRVGAVTGLAEASSVTAKMDKGTLVFNVKDYGAVGNGLTNDFAAIQTTYNAAYTAGGGVVFFPPGTYYLNTATAGIQLNTATGTGRPPGHVTFQGAGKYATMIKLSNNCKRFLAIQTGSGLTVWGGNFAVEDLTVDSNNVSGAYATGGGAIFETVNYLNIENIRVSRVDTINLGSSIPTGALAPRLSFSISLDGAPASSLVNQIVCRNILIEDCAFGRSGGGGNYGICIQTWTSGGNTGWTLETNQVYRAYVYFDNIHFKRVSHYTSGYTEFASSANFMVGSYGYGGRVVIEDCYGENSCDVGIELDSIFDVNIIRTKIVNPESSTVYLLNLGGMMEPEKQHALVKECVFIGNNLYLAQPPGRPGFGHCVIDKCEWYSAGIKTYGDWKSLTIRDTIFNKPTSFTGASFSGANFLALEQDGDGGKLTIDNVHLNFDVTHTGSGTQQLAMSMIEMSSVTDVTLDIRNLFVKGKLVSWGSASRPPVNVKVLELFENAYGNKQDTMTTSSVINRYTEAGSSSNWAETSTGAAGLTNLTTENRILIRSDDDYFRGAINPTVDGTYSMQVLPGTTVTGFKAGVGQWIRTDYFTEAYITDDGTYSFLCVDKVVGGTRTSLLGTIVDGGAGTVTTITSPASYQSDRGIRFATRIASGDTNGLRYSIGGNVMTVGYAIVGPTHMISTTPTDYSASITLTGQDAILLGEYAPGRPFFSYTPIDTSARLKNFWYDKRIVGRGVIEGVRIDEARNWNDVWMLHTLNSSRNTDFLSRIFVRNCDLNGFRQAAGTKKDYEYSSYKMGKVIQWSNNVLVGTYNSAAVTAPGTGTAYTVVDSQPVVIAWTGGTLTTPYVEVSTDLGVTWTQKWAGNKAGQIALEPEDQIRWTYSSAPTFTKYPLTDYQSLKSLKAANTGMGGY